MNEIRRIDPRRYPIGRGHQAMGEALHEELEWYAAGGDPPPILGLVLRDKVDNDYSWVVLARGANLQYQAIDMAVSIPTCERAADALRSAMSRWIAESEGGVSS
jgi:hypothetical protein